MKISVVKIKRARLVRGWTQVELAVRAGVDPITVSRIERGAHQPTLDTLGRLARVLQVEPSALFTS